MTRQKIIAGNWKMNGDLLQNESLLKTITRESFSSCCVIFPPVVYLSQVSFLLKDTKIQWGAQNVSHYENNGAYTGEISIHMLKDLECQYVLLGHSERRTLFGETSQSVLEKCRMVQNHGLISMLCIGETLEEREKGLTTKVLESQLEGLSTSDLELLVIAYEPIWAIGTGLTATPKQAQETHAWIRQYIHTKSPKAAEKIQILYGGSVKASNAKDLLSMPDIDGALVGGAALNAEEFLNILSST